MMTAKERMMGLTQWGLMLTGAYTGAYLHWASGVRLLMIVAWVPAGLMATTLVLSTFVPSARDNVVSAFKSSRGDPLLVGMVVYRVLLMLALLETGCWWSALVVALTWMSKEWLKAME